MRRWIAVLAVLVVVACTRRPGTNRFADAGERQGALGSPCARDVQCEPRLRCLAYVCGVAPDAAVLSDAGLVDAASVVDAAVPPDAGTITDAAMPPDAAVFDAGAVDGGDLDGSTPDDGGPTDAALND